jgi:hypothetical protein
MITNGKADPKIIPNRDEAFSMDDGTSKASTRTPATKRINFNLHAITFPFSTFPFISVHNILIKGFEPIAEENESTVSARKIVIVLTLYSTVIVLTILKYLKKYLADFDAVCSI